MIIKGEITIMKFIFALMIHITLFLPFNAYANPYWDAQKVPKDSSYSPLISTNTNTLKTVANDAAIDVLRIQIDWKEANESYTVSKMVIESSGTPALLMRSKLKPRWGSYLGVLKDDKTGLTVYYDAIGTGKEYRKLTRAINLRFPLPVEDMTFELFAENPTTGIMEKVVTQKIAATQLQKQSTAIEDVEVKELALATKTPSLRINIYAEGYLADEKSSFWQHAMKVVNVLQREKFPGLEYMSFYAVFHPSAQKLGSPKNLGLPVPEFNSFLGLYYPYWNNFGRWYDIVYPTRENKLRQGLATAPYDYPIVLINHSGYWGVGNYLSLTAIPAANSTYFTYLLLHEFGHFFGLNEEYEGGGRTELEFAPGITEPWSQNITFLMNKSHANLKWNTFVDARTKLPTPDSMWKSSPPVYGAYKGGYGDSKSTLSTSHKPGLSCMMESREHFCDICIQGIKQVIDYSLGLKAESGTNIDY